jgi:hypothetical protein
MVVKVSVRDTGPHRKTAWCDFNRRLGAAETMSASGIATAPRQAETALLPSHRTSERGRSLRKLLGKRTLNSGCTGENSAGGALVRKD